MFRFASRRCRLPRAISVLAPSLLFGQQVTVVRGATLIDGNGGPPRAAMAVVIRGRNITGISPVAGFRVPAGARVIDAKGRWLVPGFIDMHAHANVSPTELDSVTKAFRVTPDSSVHGRTLRSLLAMGVTTIRDPAGPAEQEVAVRDSVAAGKIVGPRMFVAGEAIDQSVGPGLIATVHTEDDVRSAVRRQAAIGVDYIKLYATLTPPLVRAGIDEAHAFHKKAIGHLFLTSWTEGANAGIDGLLHAVPSSPRLLRPDRRAAFMSGFHNTRFMFQWFEYADFASPEIDSMITAMIAHHVVHDPTLVTFEAMAWGDDPRITQNPDLVLAAPSMVANWRSSFTLTQGWLKQDFDSAKAVWPKLLQFEKLLYDRGVLLTVGTDANNPFTAPGGSFHREMELLVSAGIPPRCVIRLATRNGAEALGMLDSLGTVAVGKLADMVLLDADPFADIRNTRRIEWVMKGGEIFRPVDLLRSNPTIKAQQR